MRSGIIATSIALALAANACAQTPPPQPEPPSTPPSPPAALEADGLETHPGAHGSSLEPARLQARERDAVAREQNTIARQQNDLARQREVLVKEARGMMAAEPVLFRVPGWAPTDRPVVITTEPLTAEVEAELTEDLGVMDKLLGDETTRAGGGPGAPRAMGIKLSSVAMAEPTYIEGLGAVFEYRVSVPLAGGAGGGNAATKPAPPSAWDTAKRELTARRSPEGYDVIAKKMMTTEMPPFDPARVEELTRAIVKTLPEAKNMRHLKEADVVIVTVSGTDEAGKPMRMTLRAKKSDIDQAGSGAMTPEAFAERVARRIG